MKKNVLILCFFTISTLIFVNCKHEHAEIDHLTDVCFDSQVLPIFQANCAMSGCHGSSGGELIELVSYASIMQGISPGNPEKSEIYKAITNKWGELMPPKGNNQLTKEQRTLIFVWIKQGAQETTCLVEDSILPLPDTICFNEKILPLMKHSCAISGCHDQTTAQNNVNLSTYSDIMTGSPYQLVDVGNANSSPLYQITNLTMPPIPKSPLTTLQKQELLTWINNGAENNSCGSLVEYPVDTIITFPDSICFEQKILPILQSSCAISNCHDQTTAQGDIILTSYNSLINSEEALIVPGNATNSKIYKVITGQGEDLMPPSPNSPLISKQIEWFQTWINDGALNSSCDFGCDTISVTYSKTITQIVQNNCLGCHSGSTPQSGIDLSTYTGVFTVANQGKLLDVIEQKNGYPLMPPSGMLPDCIIRQFQIWVALGAQNNK